MKKYVVSMLLICCLTLVSCGTEKFSYSEELNTLISSYNATHSCFANNSFEEHLSTTSNSYRILITAIYEDSYMELIQSSDAVVSCGVAYFDYEDAFQKVTSDTSGFVHDVKNLYDLNIAQSEINEYVYDYLYLMILSCNKQQRAIECTLTQCSTAPFTFVDNDAIINQIILDVNQLVYDCENYAKEYSVTENSNSEEVCVFSEIDIGNTYVLNYFYDNEYVPISITVKDIMFGNEAKNKALQLSSNNSKLISDNLVYVEYEVHNYSANNIVFTSKFYDCDIDNSDIYTDDVSFVGVNKSCNIASGSNTMINDLIVINHGDLVWYDKNAGELYLLNQK